jgi:hypothetical protein
MLRPVALALSALLALAVAAAPAAATTTHKPRPRFPPQGPGTPVVVTLLDGSAATLQVAGQTRTVALHGTATGLIKGGYLLNRDNVITLQSAHVALGPTDLLGDACGTRAPVATSTLSSIGLRPTAASRVTIGRDGAVTSAVGGLLRLVLDVRGAGCGAPTAPTGWAETPIVIRPSGQIVRGQGLAALALDSPPQPVTVAACLAPAAPTAPCPVPPTLLDAALSTHLLVNVVVGGPMPARAR